MRRQEKSPHRLAHVEHSSSSPVDLLTLDKGDVFVREGAPHMVVEVADTVHGLIPNPDDTVWICNLQTGSVWSEDVEKKVYPATNVMLEFKTTRRYD